MVDFAGLKIQKDKGRALAFKCINKPGQTNCNKEGLMDNIDIFGEDYYRTEVSNDPAHSAYPAALQKHLLNGNA